MPNKYELGNGLIPLGAKHGRYLYIKYKCKCVVCRKAASVYQVERVKALVAQGKCKSCGKPHVDGLQYRCKACNEKSTIYNRKMRETNKLLKTLGVF